MFDAGKHWKGLRSIIISHVEDEAFIFTPKGLNEAATFDAFMDGFIPQVAVASVARAIRARYDCWKSPYFGNFFSCLQDLIRDGFFTCNARQLHDAYRSISPYMMSFGFPAPYLPAALHASDLLATFIHSELNVSALLDGIGVPLSGASLLIPLSQQYQTYLASHAMTGDPNAVQPADATEWLAAGSDDDQLLNVFRVKSPAPLGGYFDNAYRDPIITDSICSFWTQAAENITTLMGGGYPAGVQAWGHELEL